MKTKEFAPSKNLKTIWIIFGLLVSCIIGTFCIGIALAIDVNEAYGFWIGFIISGTLIIGYISLYFPTIRYSIDNEYVICSSGVLWKVKRSIPLDKITNIDVRQGPLERLFGFGQIWIFTPSTGSNIPEEKLIGTEDPYAIKKLLIDISNKREEGLELSTIKPPKIDDQESTMEVLREILTTLKNIDNKLNHK